MLQLTKKTVKAAVIRLSEAIDADWLKGYPKLKYLISPTTALTHINRELCAEKRVQIISLLDVKQELKNITATAGLALGLMLCLARNIHPAINHTKRGGGIETNCGIQL